MSSRINYLLQQNEILKSYHEALFGEGTAGQLFLDLSCGTRTDIREVVEGLGSRWVGVDQIDCPGVIKADVHHLPFENSMFDVVFSAATFEHYYDPWQVAREVHRVVKPGGLFCGLIAFLQPWHGDSYYHFSYLGTRQMLSVSGFEVLDIRAGNDHAVPYLIRQMFPEPFAVVGKALSTYGSFLALVRKKTFPLLVRLLYFNNKEAKEKRLQFLNDDDLRFAASILYLSRKPDS
jgi:ubiquinone/menaquinone biosynthesis C-methylase UbiE